MSDEWDAKARELALGFLRDPEDVFITDHVQLNALADEISAALRAAYEKGVEDSALKAAYWAAKGGGIDLIVSRIRALKGEGR